MSSTERDLLEVEPREPLEVLPCNGTIFMISFCSKYKVTMHDQYPAHEHATILETNLQVWHTRMEELMAAGTRIIAFRGAGSANGIEPAAADAIGTMLHRHVTDLIEAGIPVALLCDGDNDVRERPTLGSVFGTLVDSFAGNPGVTAIAVQTTGWYKPRSEGAALASAIGTPYETYVFDKEMPEIDPSLKGRGLAHSALTQSDALVAYPNYEQIIVGAAGSIAASQLHDLAKKAARRPQAARPVPVTVLAAPVNPAVEKRLQDTVQNDPDEVRRARAVEKLAQRLERPYGALCLPTGELGLSEFDYPNVSFQTFLIR